MARLAAQAVAAVIVGIAERWYSNALFLAFAPSLTKRITKARAAVVMSDRTSSGDGNALFGGWAKTEADFGHNTISTSIALFAALGR